MTKLLKKTSNYYKRCKNRGFSLIELIAVIGIIAILSVAILPTVTGSKNKAMKARYLSDCKNIISAVEIYNATSSSDNITEATTIEQLETKLVSGMNENDRYLKKWPEKLPSELEDANSTYGELLNYVNNFKLQSNSDVSQ